MLMPLLVGGQVLGSADLEKLRSVVCKHEPDSVPKFQGQLGLFSTLFPTHRAAGASPLDPPF